MAQQKKLKVKIQRPKLLSKLMLVVPFGITFLAFIFTISPLLHHGFFPTFDDIQVVRIDVMFRELLSGQIPVRYVNEFGNNGGYFLFNFYSPLVYYLGALLHFIGFTLVKSTKLVFILGYLLGGVGIFVLLKAYCDKLSSVLGVTLFLTASYLGYDVYTRGDLAEFFAFAMLPWIFWIFLSLKKHPNLNRLFIAGFLYALLIISHNIISYITSIFIFLLLILPPYSKKTTIYYIFSIITASIFSASYWIPLFSEYKFLNLTSNSSIVGQYFSNFLSPLQIAGFQKIPWGFRPPILGSGLFVGIIFSALILLHHYKKERNINSVSIFAFLGILLSIFLISNLSKPLWDMVPFFRYIQFPWRFLAVVTVLAVLLISVTISKFTNAVIKIIFFMLLLIPAVTINYQYLKPSEYNYIATYKAEDICSTTTWAQEYLPMWTKKCFPKDNHLPLVYSRDPIIISNINSVQNGRKTFFNTYGNGGRVYFAKYYFPGWQVIMDENINIKLYPSGNQGLITFDVPSGRHSIVVSLKDTNARFIGNMLTLISIFIFSAYFIFAVIKKVVKYKK